MYSVTSFGGLVRQICNIGICFLFCFLEIKQTVNVKLQAECFSFLLVTWWQYLEERKKELLLTGMFLFFCFLKCAQFLNFLLLLAADCWCWVILGGKRS